MATKSILKDIQISDRKQAHSFMKALKQAEKCRYKPAVLSKECREITGEEIKEFFGK